MNEVLRSASLCSIHPSPADGPACKCLAGEGGIGVGVGGGLIDLAFEI